MKTLEILIERSSELETRHVIHAAKRGLLEDLLIGSDLADDDSIEWADVWSAHHDAGHDVPAYDHTSDDDVNSERGIVWGSDSLSAFGVTHQVGWSANYGGNNPGWNGVSHYDWVVEEDGEGCSHNDCLQAMAEEYDIDLTDGQPAEPERSECSRERNAEQTVYVVTATGEMKEVEIYRFSHPKEDLQEDWESEFAAAADSPFPSYYSDEDGGVEYDSVSEMIAALQNEDDTHSVHDDEDEANAAQLHLLAELAVEAHGEPEHCGLVVPEIDLPAPRAGERSSFLAVAVPYVLPLDAEDVEEDRYHLDADEWRNVIDAGWVALTQTLAEAWGKRAMLAALKDERDYAEAILTNRPHTVWVSLASSYAAGNCRQGTSAFLREHSIDPSQVGAIRADALLEMDPSNRFARKACILAALGLR